jgi:magnesium-transporting ATPase (P-type)
VANYRDFPSTAVAIARQCGIIENEKVDDLSDLISDLNAPVKEYNPDNPDRICTSIVLSGKDLSEMKDAQWNQVVFIIFRS